MNNLMRTISGIVALWLSVSSHLRADFVLEMDNQNVRKSNGVYEVDAIFRVGPNEGTQIQKILLSLGVFPSDINLTPNDIVGVEFIGLTNAATNPLFVNAIVNPPDVSAKLSMFGSLEVSQPVTPVDGKRAFTVLLRSNRSDDVDVNVDFLFGQYYAQLSGQEVPKDFRSLSASGSFTISAVPEPCTCLLGALGLGGVALMRRKKKI